MSAGTGFGSRRIEVPCTIEVEHTPRSLHAHVELQDVEIGPGDSVLVHDAPVDVGFGERVVRRSRATVLRAGPFSRLWARLAGLLELTELYEVSFTPRRTL